MAKGGRARATKRPTPAVKRPATTNPSPPVSNVAATPPKHPVAPRQANAPTAPAPAAPKPTPVTPPVVTPTNKAKTVPALSPIEQWVSAFTRGFPYVLAEYCLFLLAIFAGPVVALIVGAILVIIIAANRLAGGQLIARVPAQVVREAETIVGQRDDVLISLGVMGLGLLSWVVWHATTIMLFSWLSIVALLVALFLLFYAQRIQTPRETGTP